VPGGRPAHSTANGGVASILRERSRETRRRRGLRGGESSCNNLFRLGSLSSLFDAESGPFFFFYSSTSSFSFSSSLFLFLFSSSASLVCTLSVSPFSFEKPARASYSRPYMRMIAVVLESEYVAQPDFVNRRVRYRGSTYVSDLLSVRYISDSSLYSSHDGRCATNTGGENP